LYAIYCNKPPAPVFLYVDIIPRYFRLFPLKNPAIYLNAIVFLKGVLQIMYQVMARREGGKFKGDLIRSGFNCRLSKPYSCVSAVF